MNEKAAVIGCSATGTVPALAQAAAEGAASAGAGVRFRHLAEVVLRALTPGFDEKRLEPATPSARPCAVANAARHASCSTSSRERHSSAVAWR